MESSIQLLENAFNDYQNCKYKEAADQLIKFKQLKEQSDSNQQMTQVNENIALCEYQLNRQGGKDNLIKKLGKRDYLHKYFQDDLSDEIKYRKENSQHKKNKDCDENIIEDESIIQYNKAVVLFNQGKMKEAFDTLRKIFYLNNLGYFIKIRYALFLIEISFILKNYDTVWEVYNKINEDTQYSAQNLSISSIQEQDSKENDEIEQVQTQNLKHKVQYQNAFLLGSEIHAHDISPSIVNQEELRFIFKFIKMRLAILDRDYDGKKVLFKKQKNHQNFSLDYETFRPSTEIIYINHRGRGQQVTPIQ